jgi:hypothetical protein
MNGPQTAGSVTLGLKQPAPQAYLRFRLGSTSLRNQPFWSGNGKLETAVKDWQKKIRKLFDLAQFPEGRQLLALTPIPGYFFGRTALCRRAHSTAFP